MKTVFIDLCIVFFHFINSEKRAKLIPDSKPIMFPVIFEISNLPAKNKHIPIIHIITVIRFIDLNLDFKNIGSRKII